LFEELIRELRRLEDHRQISESIPSDAERYFDRILLRFSYECGSKEPIACAGSPSGLAFCFS